MASMHQDKQCCVCGEDGCITLWYRYKFCRQCYDRLSDEDRESIGREYREQRALRCLEEL